LGQQFRKCIAGRKDRGPAVMHLTGLLPDVLPPKVGWVFA
jgi:hypothetical protein